MVRRLSSSARLASIWAHRSNVTNCAMTCGIMGSRHTYRCWTVTRHSTFYNIKKSTIMATKRQQAMIIAMAAMVGTSTDIIDRNAAAAALRDMRSDIGHDQTCSIQEDPFDFSYTWDPTDGDVA